MFGLGMVRKYAARETREELREVESWLLGHSIRFAAEIAERFEDIPQVLAASEGLAFHLHALRREAFRSSEWRAWNTVFEPALKQMIQIFAMTLTAWSGSDLDRDSLAKDVENLISSRSLEYQTIPFLSGEPEDRQTVIWSACRHIANTVDPAEREEVIAFVHEFFTRVVETDLAEQVTKLQKLLYGRRAEAAA